MSHEKSVTVERNGRFVNVYGPDAGTVQARGQVLPPLLPFEKFSYPTLAQALLAAQQRSAFWGTQGPQSEVLARGGPLAEILHYGGSPVTPRLAALAAQLGPPR